MSALGTYTHTHTHTPLGRRGVKNKNGGQCSQLVRTAFNILKIRRGEIIIRREREKRIMSEKKKETKRER